jgi:hypothetical protein
MPDPELGNGWAPVKKKRAHAREYVLEALCFVSEVDIKRLTRFDGGDVRAGAKDLRQIKGVPNDTVGYAEVVRRAQVYRKMRADIEGKQPHQVKVTAAGLVKNWDRCKDAPAETVQPGGPSRKEQAEREDRTRRNQQAARVWWQTLTSDNRAIHRGGAFLNEQHEFEAAMREFDKAGRPGLKENANAHG